MDRIEQLFACTFGLILMALLGVLYMTSIDALKCHNTTGYYDCSLKAKEIAVNLKKRKL